VSLAPSPRKDLAERVADILSSPAVNVLAGIVGIAIPVIAWASRRVATADILLAVESVLVLSLVSSHLWLHRTHIYLPRPAIRGMSDPAYFGLVRSRLESDLIADFTEIADGHLLAHAADADRLATLLLRTLIDSPAQPKRALATDLATPSGVHLARLSREYLAENRRLIDAGGEIQRIFLCWAADLATEQYARRLHELVASQRSAGVQCGLAIRDRLSPEQAVDFVVLAEAVVSVQEDQATRGRITIHFRNVGRWVRRYESIWGHGALSAASALAAYENIARPMLSSGSWDKATMRSHLEQL
jgi:hypothetical protein